MIKDDVGVSEREVRDDRINVQNVSLAYLVEMNESRANLFTALKYFRKDVPKSHFESFLSSFTKFYDLSSTILEEDHKMLMEDIDHWLELVNPFNIEDMKKGIKLSKDLQRTLEEESMFPLFAVPIRPPYV